MRLIQSCCPLSTFYTQRSSRTLQNHSRCWSPGSPLCVQQCAHSAHTWRLMSGNRASSVWWSYSSYSGLKGWTPCWTPSLSARKSWCTCTTTDISVTYGEIPHSDIFVTWSNTKLETGRAINKFISRQSTPCMCAEQRLWYNSERRNCGLWKAGFVVRIDWDSLGRIWYDDFGGLLVFISIEVRILAIRLPSWIG